MHPYLFKYGKFAIHTYGFFVAMGCLSAFFIAKLEAKRLGQDIEKITDLFFYLIVAAIIGSRLFYVAITPEIFLENPLEIFKIWKGGLVFYGGFIAAFFTMLIFVKKKKLSFWKIADLMSPCLAFGHFFGRLGCFFAGCCYGKTCDLPWAVTFTHQDALAPVGIPLHPTQLYASFGNLIIFGLLWFYRSRKKFDGHLFLIYIILYGVSRSLIEVFRGDFRGNSIFGVLSVSQEIGAGMVVIAIIMMLILGRRSSTKKK